MNMDSLKQLFSLSCLPLLLLLLSGHTRLQFAEARAQRNKMNYPSKTLFVFGDSYVDAGNTRIDKSLAWKEPYGIYFPEKPAGRFSNGRVLSDFIAKYLGLRSPVPYEFMKLMEQHLKSGINFAYGGTGVFDTFEKYPNMTTQIGYLEQLIKENVYTTSDLNSSVAYVSVSGNDYSFYMIKNTSNQGFPAFMASVVDQTVTNLRRIKSLGVRKVVVGGLHPLGCLPPATFTSAFTQCNSSFNDLIGIHNNLLKEAVANLNQQEGNKDGSSTFVVLDHFNAFMSVLSNPSNNNIKVPFMPCCRGLKTGFICGNKDKNNVKQYKVCDNQESTFFWDILHPTQAGWNAVYNKLQMTSDFQQFRE